MRLMSEEERAGALDGLPGWALEGAAITRTWSFVDFLAAMRFVNGAAALAEEMGHHPDMDIRYNRVKVALTTHDAGGLTDRDFGLAARLDRVEAAGV